MDPQPLRDSTDLLMTAGLVFIAAVATLGMLAIIGVRAANARHRPLGRAAFAVTVTTEAVLGIGMLTIGTWPVTLSTASLLVLHMRAWRHAHNAAATPQAPATDSAVSDATEVLGTPPVVDPG